MSAFSLDDGRNSQVFLGFAELSLGDFSHCIYVPARLACLPLSLRVNQHIR